MLLRHIFEADGKTAVFAFGRMNPPTIGHAKLADVVKQQPGTPFLFLTHTQKPKTDPLTFAEKVFFARKCFGDGITIGSDSVRTIIDAMKFLYARKFTDIIYVAGDDRVNSFNELLNKYNGGDDYSFNSINVVSAGQRDPDAEGAEGMSATKMKQAAADNDLQTFKSGVCSTDPKVAKMLFNKVRAGMGITESTINELDLWAPKVTYIKSMDDKYYKAEYRSSTGPSGRGSDEKARWIKVTGPVSDKVVQGMGFDQILDRSSKNFNATQTISFGHGVQSGTPISDPVISVYAMNTRKYRDEVPYGVKAALLKYLSGESDTDTSENTLEDEAKFYDNLYNKLNGVWFRGEGQGGKGLGLGALGKGTYLTWTEDAAKAFSIHHGSDGEVVKYKVKPGLKIADYQSKEVADIKKSMGFEPWEYSGDQMYSAILTMELQQAGYDGMISDKAIEGLVIFDAKNITRAEGESYS